MILGGRRHIEPSSRSFTANHMLSISRGHSSRDPGLGQAPSPEALYLLPHLLSGHSTFDICPHTRQVGRVFEFLVHPVWEVWDQAHAE